MKITLTINKKKKRPFEIQANFTLLDFLRAQGFWSLRRGCETGECGSCTVIVNGKAVNSCLMLAVQVDGKTVETWEALDTPSIFDTLKEAFSDFSDIQCGYCIPGMVMSLKALLDKNPEATVEEVVEAISGNHCYCTGNVKPVGEIMKAIRKMRGQWK